MKHLLTSLCLMLVAASAVAIPAKRVRKTLVQPDGTTIAATFGGDEHLSFYVNDRGERLRQDADGYWRPMGDAAVAAEDVRWTMRRKTRAAELATIDGVPSIGEHRCLVLLVEFSNLKFSAVGTVDNFHDMLNGTDYTFQGATGSAQRYFRDQSLEKYTPTFDVIGPVTLANTYKYYGGNDSYGDDLRPREMVSEGITAAMAANLIDDLSVYDGDGDGYVDLVYVLYAGFSEAEGAGNSYIWPHAWVLASPIDFNGMKVYKYACSSELKGTPDETATDPQLDGIGSCVHEFGHCLGLPDFYNTGSRSGCYGMDAWSVMDQGCYNNDGKTPPAYSAYERASVGWMDYDTLPAAGDITLHPIDTDNAAFIYRNPANADEYFLFENRQTQGWDTYFGGYGLHGLMITHVDYDAKVWDENTVNNDPDHQRYTVVPADGTLESYDKFGYAQSNKWFESFTGDIWPGSAAATSFSATTTPSATFFTGDTATFDIRDIAENADGTITFTLYVPQIETGIASVIDKNAFGTDATTIYDISGRTVRTGTTRNGVQGTTLPRGLYIVKENGISRKVFIP